MQKVNIMNQHHAYPKNSRSAKWGQTSKSTVSIQGKGEKMQLFKAKSPYVESVIKRAIALTVMITITVSSVVTVAAATCNAEVEFDGSTKRVQLFSRKTQDVLSAAGVETDARDIVQRNDAPESGGSLKIVVKSGYEIKIAADNSVKTVIAHYGDTVADVLDLAGITVGEKDVVVPAEDTAVTEGMLVQMKRKYSVTVTADGNSQTTVVTEGTVAEALTQAGIKLNEDDIVNPAKSAPVSEGMKLTVARVTYKDVTTTKDIAYTNTNVNDGSLYQGDRKVKTAGKNGSQSIVTRQKFIDGALSSSEVIKTTIITQPVNKVTLVGTKKRPAAYASITADGTVKDQSGSLVNYKKCITGRCTAYTGGGWTSTGRPAAFGLVAVNPNVIPYGSRLYICSPDGRIVYGYAIAADTGGAAMQGRIVADLYYNTASQCSKFGVRNMKIYVL